MQNIVCILFLLKFKAERVKDPSCFFSEKGFQTLDIHLIKLVDDSCHEVLQLEETKISSSNRRIRLLGEELRAPYKPFSMPYIIGNNISHKNEVVRIFCEKQFPHAAVE